MSLGGLINKEFGRIRSDKRTLILLFLIPIILIFIFGLTTGVGPTKFFTAAIITRDDRPTYGDFPANSSTYDDSFISIMQNNSTTWTLHRYFNSTTESEYGSAYISCYNFLKNEVIDIFIVIPENFSESVAKSINPVLIYYIDGSDLSALSAVEVAIQEPIALFRVDANLLANFSMVIPYLEFDVPFWESQLLNYAIPLILPIIILGTTMNLTSLSIVSEGPLPRMLITPTTKREIILSKLIANSTIMFLQSTEIFIMSAFFGLYSLGSLFYFYLALIMIGFCGICIGLFISALSPTEQGANQMYLIMFIVIVLFSGNFLPTDLISPVMRYVINALPLSHAIPLITDITLKGLPPSLYHLMFLNLDSLIFIALAYIIYKFKKLEV
ncbi:MAG: ABC transporter permease [Promethearchaeota archaeon]|nr:MAG: ABC transporter permease [Candidatus Lokiarchaeota archaeon]